MVSRRLCHNRRDGRLRGRVQHGHGVRHQRRHADPAVRGVRRRPRLWRAVQQRLGRASQLYAHSDGGARPPVRAHRDRAQRGLDRGRAKPTRGHRPAGANAGALPSRRQGAARGRQRVVVSVAGPVRSRRHCGDCSRVRRCGRGEWRADPSARRGPRRIGERELQGRVGRVKPHAHVRVRRLGRPRYRPLGKLGRAWPGRRRGDH